MRVDSESSFEVIELTDEDLSEVSGGCGAGRGRRARNNGRGNNQAGQQAKTQQGRRRQHGNRRRAN